MKLKKFVAVGLAATMMVMPMTVFADELTAPTTGEEATVEGNVNYIDTTVYKVTLPTTSGLDFVLDPQGLSALDKTTPVQPADADKGKIVGGVGTACINKSSVPIKLTASFYVTDGAGKASTAATLVSSTDGITDENANQVLLKIVPNGATAPTADEAADMKTYTTWSDADAVAITATAASAANKVEFALEPADYEFTGDKNTGYQYTPKATGTGVTTETVAAFKIDGSVSKDGDWSKFKATDNAETLVLHCVFSFEGLKEIGADAVSSTAACLVVDATKLTGMTPASNDLTATITTGANRDVILTAEDTISSAKLTTLDGATVDYAITSTHATISGSKITIKGTWLSGRKEKHIEITLTLANGKTQKVILDAAS